MSIPSICLIPSGYKANKLYSVLPTNGAGDLDFSRAGNATRVNQNGLLESVLPNVPRLDYSDGGCPSLLLEPQSTNLLNYSEEFDNSYWTKSGSSITPNNSISPFGDLTMDLLRESAINESHNLLTAPISITPNITQTISVFFKKQTGSAQRFLRLDLVGNSFTNGARGLFDIELGTIALSAINIGTGTDAIAKIEDYGNGIYRASLSVNLNGGLTACRVQFILQNQGIGYSSAYLGDGVSGVNLWGVQLEALPYATSYIKTEGSTVTRIKDTASKSGLSSLINSSEGVLYVEIEDINNQAAFQNQIGISDGSNTNRIQFISVIGATSLIFRMAVVVNNVNVADKTWAIGSINYPVKASISYKENNFQLHVNGSKVGEDLIGNTFPVNTLNTLKFSDGNNTVPFQGKIKNLQIYNTALTDLELEELTSYTSFSQMATALKYEII